MDDGLRFDPSARRGHVESWFLKINDPRAERALWVKATVLSRLFGAPVAESWAIAFERGKAPFARKATVAFEDGRFSRTAIDVELPTLRLSRSAARGAHDGVAFDLALADETPPLLLYPRRMYETPFPTTKLASPMPNLVARGEVRAFGETWNVDGWRGMLGHNWGRAHTFAYAWAHCNVWDDPVDLVFEGASGRVRLGPALLPLRTTVVVRLNGETHALNHVSEILRNEASMTFRRWRFSARGPTLSVRGELFAETEDMAGLHYENPDGAMTYCLNSKLASARLAIAPSGGLPFVVSSRSAALEIGTRDRAHGVRMIA